MSQDGPSEPKASRLPEQLEVLGKHGCGLAQGFYFSRPLPADQCHKLLVQASRRTSFTDMLRMQLIPANPSDLVEIPMLRRRTGNAA